jgi:hypothetical protein
MKVASSPWLSTFGCLTLFMLSGFANAQDRNIVLEGRQRFAVLRCGKCETCESEYRQLLFAFNLDTYLLRQVNADGV